MITSAAVAQERTLAFDLPAEPLADALRDYGKAADRQLIFAPDLVQGHSAKAMKGRYGATQALDLLLSGTDLTWRQAPAGGIMIVRRTATNPPAPAATDSAGAESSRLAEVVVTGTRIEGARPTGPQLITLSREDIAVAGRLTAGDLLKTLPQNVSIGAGMETRSGVQAGPSNLSFAEAVNLRGLGVDATLTLINGHRAAQSYQGGFVDISQLPLLAVERVEVVPDGASAIYGSDAVGGVVNFVFRKNFDGAETVLTAGGGQGFERYRAGQSFGRTWSGGSAFVAMEYYRQTRLRATERSYYTNDLRAFGGPDLRTNNASPGNIQVGSVLFAIPPGQNGVGLTSAQLIANTVNKINLWAPADILPSTEKYSVAGTFNQDLGHGLSLFFDGIATRRDSVRNANGLSSTLTVPKSNPFFVSPTPGAQSVTVIYNFVGDYGPQATGGPDTDYSLHGGLNAALPLDWHGQLAGLLSQNRTEFLSNYVPNVTFVAAALADPNPATAFNPFGAAGSNSKAVLEAVRGHSNFYSKLKLSSINLDLGGPVLTLPGGRVRLAVGGEFRREQLGNLLDFFTSGTTPQLIPTNASRTINAGYAELFVPLVGPDNAIAGIQRLELSAAVRGEHYSDSGSTTNPKFGLTWQTTQELEFSGSWGTSFKTPNLFQKSTGSNRYSVTALVDARFPGGRANVLQLSGNDPNLTPESAKTWTLAAAYHPSWAPGLALTADYFNVHYRNRILAATTAEVVNAVLSSAPSPLVPIRGLTDDQLAVYYNSPLFSTASQKLPASQIVAVADFRARNAGRVEETGFDFTVSDDVDTRWGRLGGSVGVEHIDHYAVARVATAPTTDFLNLISNPVSWQGRSQLRWSDGPWSASVAVSFVGSYTNNTVSPVQRVPAWSTADLHVGYQLDRPGLLKGVRLALDVQNLMDADPPLTANAAAQLGYDPQYATAIGRVVALTLDKRW